MATKQRYSMSGLPVEEQEKHGRQMADKRYGPLEYQFDAPAPAPDYSYVQDCGDKWGYSGNRPRGYENDAAGWVRGAASGKPTMENETGEAMPHFDSRDPKTGLPKKW